MLKPIIDAGLLSLVLVFAVQAAPAWADGPHAPRIRVIRVNPGVSPGVRPQPRSVPILHVITIDSATVREAPRQTSAIFVAPQSTEPRAVVSVVRSLPAQVGPTIYTTPLTMPTAASAYAAIGRPVPAAPTAQQLPRHLAVALLVPQPSEQRAPAIAVFRDSPGAGAAPVLSASRPTTARPLPPAIADLVRRREVARSAQTVPLYAPPLSSSTSPAIVATAEASVQDAPPPEAIMTTAPASPVSAAASSGTAGSRGHELTSTAAYLAGLLLFCSFLTAQVLLLRHLLVRK